MKYAILRRCDALYHKLFPTPGTFLWYHLRFLCDWYDYSFVRPMYSQEELDFMKMDDKMNAIATREAYKNR